jgi:sporulation protein YqfC
MRQYGKTLQRLSDSIYQTNDAFPGMPVLEMAGDQRVLIENHMGVIEYGKERICVKVKYGVLAITGDDMELAKMTKHQLVVMGRINAVTICRKECK